MSQILKNKRFLILCGVLILGIAVFGVVQKTPKSPELATTPLTQEDMAKMVKPAVVRIAQKVGGRYTIPEFDIDLSTLITSIKRAREPEYKKLNEFVTGSGFIVNQDGYILTNAHVVSKEMIKAFLLNEAFAQILEEKLKNLSKEEQKKLFEDEAKTEKFANDSLKLLMANSQFEINSTLAVLNPASQKEKIENLFATGFPAEIVSLNENFLFSNKDVALIKINQANLPTLNLGNGSQAAVGNKIFIFGFPATSELNSSNPVEPTLTQGVISALKFSESKDFKIFQTDAKVSQGSSGGPMFNQKGEVIGLVTYQTNPVYQALGDNFAFAVPINLAQKLLTAQKLAINSSDYSKNLMAGLLAFQTGRCKLAIAQFQKTLAAVNPAFAPKTFLENYISPCQQAIASDNSLDSGLGIAWGKIKNFGLLEWLEIFGRAVLMLAGAMVLFWLYGRIKKDEAAMQELEQELEETKAGIQAPKTFRGPSQPALPMPDEELHAHERLALNIPHPHLEEYVKTARGQGLVDGEIAAELLKAGWPEAEIINALKS